VNRGHLLEGYGGLGRLHRRFVLARLLVYRRRRLALIDTRDVARMHRKALTLRRLGDRQYERYAYVLIAEQEANRALAGFPEEAWRVMPTRLGNALRRHEDAAGRPYDLNAVGVMPHIALCAPPEHLAYLNDQRTLLDLSVRLCVVSLLAAAAGFVLLARDGLWLLLCLAPYLLAYVFCRGSIVAANRYGTAVSTVVALGRFRLYEQTATHADPGGCRQQAPGERAAGQAARGRARRHPVCPAACGGRPLGAVARGGCSCR